MYVYIDNVYMSIYIYIYQRVGLYIPNNKIVGNPLFIQVNLANSYDGIDKIGNLEQYVL